MITLSPKDNIKRKIMQFTQLYGKGNTKERITFLFIFFKVVYTNGFYFED